MIGCNWVSGLSNSLWNLIIWSSAAACSFGWRARPKDAISSFARETFSARNSIGSLFLVGMKKCPSLFKSFFVESHQRFHSGSGENIAEHQLADLGHRGGAPQTLENVPHDSRRILLHELLDGLEVVRFFARKCSGGMTVRFSAA